MKTLFGRDQARPSKRAMQQNDAKFRAHLREKSGCRRQRLICAAEGWKGRGLKEDKRKFEGLKNVSAKER
jgi:hypothetical protein